MTATPKIGENGGHFATTGTAAYPPAMCEWMAKTIFRSAFKNKFSGASTPSGRGSLPRSMKQMEDWTTSEEEEDGVKNVAKCLIGNK